MIIVTGTVRFGEGEIDRLKDAMARNIEATRAEAGCEHYAYAVDVCDPALLHVSERWSDDAAIERHMASPHMGAFMAQRGDINWRYHNSLARSGRSFSEQSTIVVNDLAAAGP